MSRYTCHKCEVEHGEDNMVAYCAACYDRRTTDASREAERRVIEAAKRIYEEHHNPPGYLVEAIMGLTAPAQKPEPKEDK